MSNRIIKDTIAITVITLVAGLALGVVQDITADPIAKQEAQAKQDAYKAVFADADSFETVDVDADAGRRRFGRGRGCQPRRPTTSSRYVV